jgi:hypothetical protein
VEIRNGRGPVPFLSTIVAVSAAGAAATGLLVDGLYRDNLFVTSAWRGNDLVTLTVALPLLIRAQTAARRDSVRGRLVWLGVLDYVMYTYAYYLFGARFNELFLAYVLLFTLSTIALVFGLAGLDVERVGREVGPGAPRRPIAAYLLLVGTGLTLVYVSQSIGFIVSGSVPAIVTLTEHPTSLVFALDLSLLVPGLFIGGAWLWQGRAWGYVLAAVLTVKGAIYTLALAVGSALAGRAGYGEAADQVPFWLVLCAAGTAAAAALLVPRRSGNG